MDPNAFVNIDFKNVRWPKAGIPSSFSKNVRCYFLLDNDGHVQNHDTLKDILKAWLYDEFNECPIDFEFQAVL